MSQRDQERFIIAGVDALYMAAGAMCEGAQSSEGWRWMLLRYAAERAEYVAKCNMSPADFQATKTVILAGVTGIREAGEVLAEQRQEGSRLSREALEAEREPSGGAAG